MPLLRSSLTGERLAGGVAAGLAIGLIAIIGAWLPFVASGLPAVAGPVAASAVLVFLVPASPLAQPWPVIGGSMLSALVGTIAARFIPGEAAAAAVAVGGSIVAMAIARCLHPPAAAAALGAVIGNAAVHRAGLAYALTPIGLNAILLTGAGMLYHRFSGHSYPHRPALPAVPQAPALHLEDIDRALSELPDSFDIDRADLDALLTLAEAHAVRRRIGT